MRILPYGRMFFLLISSENTKLPETEGYTYTLLFSGSVDDWSPRRVASRNTRLLHPRFTEPNKEFICLR